MNINNETDWWRAVDENWLDLLRILWDHIDMNHPAYDIPGKPDSKLTGRNCALEVEYLKTNRDGERLARYFNAAWGLASDAYAYSVPGWSVLCDLCSEEWVLHE